MKIYHFDPVSRYYLGTSVADPDPVVHAAISEREKRQFEARANARAQQDALTRGDVLVLPYPHAEPADEIAPMEPAYLFPAHCTTVAPPANIPAGSAAVWLDASWTVVELPKEPLPTADGGMVSQDFVAGDWDADHTAAEHMAWAKKVLQQHLDVVAASAGYDDMKSMVSYADEPAVPEYQAEGKAGRRWRSLFWKAATAKLAQVVAGEIPAPITVSVLLDGLPEYTGA